MSRAVNPRARVSAESVQPLARRQPLQPPLARLHPLQQPLAQRQPLQPPLARLHLFQQPLARRQPLQPNNVSAIHKAVNTTSEFFSTHEAGAGDRRLSPTDEATAAPRALTRATRSRTYTQVRVQQDVKRISGEDLRKSDVARRQAAPSRKLRLGRGTTAAERTGPRARQQSSLPQASAVLPAPPPPDDQGVR